MLDIYLNDKQKKVINTLDKNILLCLLQVQGKQKH